jgi:hypothetical protein
MNAPGSAAIAPGAFADRRQEQAFLSSLFTWKDSDGLSGGNVPLLDSVTTGTPGPMMVLLSGVNTADSTLRGVSGEDGSQGNDRACARRARVQAAPEDGTFWPVS